MMEIRLTSTTQFEYDSPGGQRIKIELPAGTVFKVPQTWVYMGVPLSDIHSDYRGRHEVYAMKCNCESFLCAQSTSHEVNDCHRTNTRQVEAFGIKQTLCEACIIFAKSRYGDRIVDQPPSK